MPATARAAKAKVQRGSSEPSKGKSVSSTQERLRALIKAKIKEKRLHWATRQMMIGRQTVDEFLDSESPLDFEHLDLFAQFLGTAPAVLLAEAVGNSTLVVEVKLLDEFIPGIQWWKAELESWWSGIVASPREEAMLAGEEEEDEATELRALLECLFRQHLAETITAAQEVAGWHKKRKK
jgi:hypothetical protein